MNLFLRVLTAIVLLPVFILCIHFGEFWFSILTIALGALLADEIVSMGFGKKSPMKMIFALPVAVLLLSLVVFPQMNVAILGIWFVLFYFAVIFTFRPQAKLDEVGRISLVVAVLIYAFLGVACFVGLRGIDAESNIGRSLVYLTLVCTFGNDTFAYLFGRWLGKHHLYEKVSQKKTWEGFIAGAIASVALPFAFIPLFKFFGVEIFSGLLMKDLLFVSIGISFLGPIGDLIESRIKRAFDIKDSGTLLPGHGGVFDRIDALLVTLPFTLGYAFFLRSLW